MSKFRKSEIREVPTLNTASLPDLIFTLLFFFMLVTNMRPVPVKTQFQLPTATELQKLEEKSLVVYIMVGKSENANITREESIAIQLNSDFVSLEELSIRLESIKDNIPLENQSKIVVVMKVDKDTPMGTVNDIRQSLRETNLLTVHYATDKKRNS